MKSKRHGNYVDDYLEWQDHKYDPGHYTGGKLRPDLSHPGKPKRLGWIFIVQGILILSLAIPVICTAGIGRFLDGVIFFTTLGVPSALSIIIGIRYIKKGKRKKHKGR